MEEDKTKSYDSSDYYGSINWRLKVEKVISEALELLLDVLKESKEYKEYRRCLAEVKKDEQIWKAVSEFQKQQFILYAAPNDNVAEKERILCRDHEALLALPSVREFQKAEKNYCRIVRIIQDQFTNDADIDISFLEE